MNRIVVATDFSDRSNLAVDRARQIAEATGASLTLIHAVDDDQPSEIVEADMERTSERLRNDVSRLTGVVAPSYDVVAGDPYWVLNEAVSRANAELLVVGDHRRNVFRDVFRDTTVERLLRLIAVPVLLARIPADHSYRRALLGIEGAEAAELTRVLDALGASGPEAMTGLHVFDAVAAGFMASVSTPTDRIEKYRQEIAESARQRIWASLAPDLQSRIRLRVEEDPVANALQTVAAEERCELIAVSTHARRGILRMLLGSVTAELIRHGTTDLLIVPRVAEPT